MGSPGDTVIAPDTHRPESAARHFYWLTSISSRAITRVAELERVRQRLQEGIEFALAATPIDVVFMGPDPSEGNAAAKLRTRLAEAAEKYGVAVKPEHRVLMTTSRATLKAGHHLTAYEMHLVKACDLVVLIPASAGSLCELGLFSMYPGASGKLIVLVSTEFPRKGSYVADGPLVAAANNQAEVHYIDYDDFDAAWCLVEARIQKDQASKSMTRLVSEGS